MMVIAWVLMLFFEVAMVAGMWMTLKKGGKPGWGALVPGFNIYLFVRMAGLSPMWIVLCIIPLVNIVATLYVYSRICKCFNLGGGFALGLLLLPVVFFPIIGFGKAKYQRSIDNE